MKNARQPQVMAYLLAWTLLMSTLAFGQDAGRLAAPQSSTAENGSMFENYLIEVPSTYDSSEAYSKESQSITHVLVSPAAKSAVLIDNNGYARDLVLQSVANRLASDPQGKKLYKVNWNALFSVSKDQSQFNAVLEGI